MLIFSCAARLCKCLFVCHCRCMGLAKARKEEDLVYCRCASITESLFKCMSAHPDYFGTAEGSESKDTTEE
jgi:GCK domain